MLLGLSLVAPPGPVMAVMAAASVQGRTKESIRTALGAITGDAIWLLLVTAGFVAVLRHHPKIIGGLGIAGGGLLLWMAWDGFMSTRRGLQTSTLRGSYKLGLVTVLSSPFSFAWWLASGPIVIASLQAPGIAGLFASLLIYTFLFTYALHWLGARFRQTAAVVGYLGAAILAFFGVFFAREGVRLLFA
jgi:threonine/homoserine/homoserine lactone efflux protein